MLYLDRSVEPLANQQVRQAMAHAVDREAFVDAVLGGAGAPAVQDFPEGYFAHNDDYPGDYYEYDPELAKQMLTDAGYPDGFSLEVLVPALSTYELGAQVLQQMLAEVGITLTFTRIEAAQAGDLMFAQDQGDAMIAQFGGRSDPQITMDLQYTADGFLNSGDNTTDTYTELSAEAKAALDPDEREALLQQMSGEVADQAFTVILAHDFNVNAYTDPVEGFNLLAGGELDFRNMSVAELTHRCGILVLTVVDQIRGVRPGSERVCGWAGSVRCGASRRTGSAACGRAALGSGGGEDVGALGDGACLWDRSSTQTLTLPTTLRRPAASTVPRAHRTSPIAGRRKRIDSSDVSAIGSIRPIAANTTYHSAASARPNCVGPEMYPPGRMSAAVAT